MVIVTEEIMIDTNSSDIEENNQPSENGLINENYVERWNTSPFPESFYAPVENHVSLIKTDPNRL